MDKIINIGSITFFINTQNFINWIPHDDASILANNLEDKFKEKFYKSNISQIVNISSVKWEYGCIVETISFSIITRVLLKSIKEYPEYRKGIIQIAKDIHNVYLYLKNTGSKHKVILTKVNLLSEDSINDKIKW